jgi:uncharacterized protein YkwD
VSGRTVYFGLLVVCLLLATLACQATGGIVTPDGRTPTIVLSPTFASTLTPVVTQVSLSPSAETSPSVTPTTVVHTVQSGDTLLGLATYYGVPIAAIQLENGLGESTVIYVGQTLVIPAASDWEGASRFWVVYEVREGETLVEIAQVYDLDPALLMEANGLTDSEVRPGDLLVLPLDSPAVAYLPTSTPAPTLTPEPTPVLPTLSSPISPIESPVPTLVPATLSPSIADWPRELVRIINDVRAIHGLPPFAYNEALAQAAQAHADDCVGRGWCSHTGSDGSDVKTRIVRAGYEPSGWAECWAQARDPGHAVEMWMDETPPDDPHRRTLLSTWVTEIGAGVAETTWGYYFITDFGRP